MAVWHLSPARFSLFHASTRTGDILIRGQNGEILFYCSSVAPRKLQSPCDPPSVVGGRGGDGLGRDLRDGSPKDRPPLYVIYVTRFVDI